MIQNLLTRTIGPINAWITILVLVIVLHGLTVWVVMSMDSPERPEIKRIETQLIQLELVTLPAEKLRTEPKLEPKPKLKLQPEKKAAEPVKKDKLAPVPEPVKQLKTEPKKEQLEPIKEQSQPEEEAKTPVPVQELITEELEKITKVTVEKEPDLSAIIRAVTEQYNRDQASQRQAARGANRARVEQDRLQAQADTAKILALAADQAEKQETAKTERARLDKEADTSNEPVNFLEEQASWLDEHEPNTSVPLQVWRNTTARSGDVFTVLLELHVDKSGYITEVQLLESSGNQIIDAVATVQVRAGQLNPLQQSGLPVNGIVPMSLSYKMP